LRLVPTGIGVTKGFGGGQELERLHLGLPVQEVGRRHPFGGGRVHNGRFGQQDDPLGVAIRQLTHEQCVDDAEDSGRRPHAERQHRDGQYREAWVTAEKARAVPHVLDEVGVACELAAEPGGVVKRSEDASKHVELLLPGESVAGG
jgi:hypothetical protein